MRDKIRNCISHAFNVIFALKWCISHMLLWHFSYTFMVFLIHLRYLSCFFACFLCISHKNRVFISHQILDYYFLCFSLTVNLLCLIACLYVVYLLFLCFILFLVVFLNRYLYCSTWVDNSFHLSGEFFPLEWTV